MISENSTRFSRSTRAAIAAVVFSAPAVVSLVPARAVAQPAAEKAAVSAGGEMTASRKKNDIGIRGHGFVQDNNVLTTIDVPGATTFSLALGTNEAGQTVGAYVDKKGRVHGFLRDSGGNFTPIDFPGAAATVAWKINALGQVVGAYSEDAGSPAFDLHHGFLLDKGVFTTIDVPGALQTQPHAINNRGQIVGEYLDSTGKYHGFLLDGGVFTTIDAPGGTSTQAYDIDDSGRIVGISFNVANLGNPMGSTVRGFLRDAQGAFTAIEAPGTTRRPSPSASTTLARS
jgi:probable HAF family extracellular repeat protein